MNKPGLLLLTALLALPLSANAEIYKWKDKDGTVRYSDTPPPSNVPHQSLGVKKAITPQPAAATSGKGGAAAKPENAEEKPQESPEQAKERQRVEEANQKIKQQNCDNAQANLKTFEQGGRISRTNEKGEREYFDDAAMAKELAKAKKEIAEFCN